MKIILLRGGIGNQLFIYGKYKYLEKLNKKVYLDDVYGFKNDIHFRRKNMLNLFNLQYKKIKINLSTLWKLLGILGDNKSIIYFSNKYYQESRFLDYVDLNFSNNISRICIHIRLRDYPLTISEDIYLSMLSLAIIKNANLPIFIICDDHFKLKSQMPNLYYKGEYLELSDIDAFTFIAESSDVILSDSSFSFSAAYLGSNKNIFFSHLTNIVNNGYNKHKWIKY